MGALAVCPSAAGANAAPPRQASAAGPPTALVASFSPKHLGAATTIALAIKIDPPRQSVPAAVSEVQVAFPSDLGLATSGLGLAECDPLALEREGESACPPDSRVGGGSASVGVAFGPSLVDEHVTLGLFAAPSNDGFIHLAIAATGLEPIDARIVMAGVLLPGRLQITVPPVTSLPGAPDVAVLSLHATLGGALTYYEHSHGHTVAYRPRGIALPEHCPRGGWRLSARLAFSDGSVSRARTVVGCPAARAR